MGNDNSAKSQCLKITQNVAFEFLNFTSFFVQLQLIRPVTLFEKFSKIRHFGIFYALLSTNCALHRLTS